MENHRLQKFFNNDSLFPLLMFILGIFVCFQFVSENYSVGVLALVIATVFDLFIVSLGKKERILTEFNHYLHEISEFLVYGLSIIVFGVVFFNDSTSYMILIVVYFFALSTVLSFARNWSLEIKHSSGWPILFNGIVFPIFYYIFRFKLEGSPLSGSLFIIFFLLVSLLNLTTYNFLGFEKRRLIDEEEEKPKKKRGIKEDVEEFYDINEEEHFDENEENNQEEETLENFDEQLNYDETNELEEEQTQQLETNQQKVVNGELAQEYVQEEKRKSFLGSLFSIFRRKKKDKFNIIQDMPDKKELKETLNDKLGEIVEEDNNQLEQTVSEEVVKEESLQADEIQEEVVQEQNIDEQNTEAQPEQVQEGDVVQQEEIPKKKRKISFGKFLFFGPPKEKKSKEEEPQVEEQTEQLPKEEEKK